ncbi:trypsin-like peptidase domain-containing protein [uncultured Acetobacteroides sp.]|uniref:trypsin-like peptidase domain-containing protein n=1 Tax=uncultured Acetobacteroides sp. TaxID=1760811 RepID=UPI0029F50101|nr:trypsin-like peptidase domain-containing protein [uncultured Acetobacteroides sp.]
MIDRIRALSLAIGLLLGISAEGQDRLPLSFSVKDLSSELIPTKKLPPIPKKAPAALRSEGRSSRYLKRLEFGSTLATSISINSEGKSDTVRSTIIHRIMVKSEGAKCLTLKLSVDQVSGFDSRNIFVYTPTRTFVASVLAKLSDKSTVVLPLVPGDCAVVEVEKPVGSKAAFTISEVVHGDRLPLKGYGSDAEVSGACMVDISCAEGQEWQVEKNSIVKILIATELGERMCSGVLVNNTSKNRHPYLLTANHCILSGEDAKNSVFYFGNEKKSCGSDNIFVGYSISGATLVASGYQGKTDFALLELSQAPPAEYLPYFAGWDVRRKPFTEPGATCLHHPNGDAKKISVDFDTPIAADFNELDPTAGFEANTHWHVERWDIGATEGGSSGAALFNSKHLVVGNLTGGLADCSNPVDDYFSRINAAWSSNPDPKYQLKYWLDPAKTGDSTLLGMGNNVVFFGTIEPSNVSVYPIPVYGGTIHIRIKPAEDNSSFVYYGSLVVSLYDVNGRKLGATPFTDPSETFDYNLPTANPGMYLLEIAAKERRVVKKIIILGR